MQSQPSVCSAAEGPPDLTDAFKSHLDRSMDICVGKSPPYVEGSGKTHTHKEQLIQAQVNDPELTPLLRDALDVAEAAKSLHFL